MTPRGAAIRTGNTSISKVPSFRIWGQRSKLLETTSWETAVEKCRTVAADPITEAWALQTEGNYAEAKKYFVEAMLLGAVHNFQARLGLLRCTLEEAINGEYSTEVESLVRDLRSHHESELEATDFSLLVQGELMAFKQTEDCAPAQCAAIEDLFKGLRVENDESARTVLFKRALDQAIEHYHRETKPKVAQAVEDGQMDAVQAENNPETYGWPAEDPAERQMGLALTRLGYRE
eukprot:GEMP01084170.1.p1 GENE.GEMP01084170.1~~GEMP01084170.1.p1  ORF type:complete len:234 (+),score=49.93 GEMP01084170.1:236-937(+)